MALRVARALRESGIAGSVGAAAEIPDTGGAIAVGTAAGMLLVCALLSDSDISLPDVPPAPVSHGLGGDCPAIASRTPRDTSFVAFCRPKTAWSYRDIDLINVANVLSLGTATRSL